MANIAGLLTHSSQRPSEFSTASSSRALADVSAHEIAAYAARWQAFCARGPAPGPTAFALCLKNGIPGRCRPGCAGSVSSSVRSTRTTNPENVAWCLENSGARLLVAENSRMADALQGVTASLPPCCASRRSGERPCAVEGGAPQAGAGVRSRPLAVDALARLLYLGTAGRPKG